MWAGYSTKIMKTLAKRASLYISMVAMGATLFSGLLNLIPTAVAAAPNCQAPYVLNPDTNSCWNPSAPASTPPPPTGFWALSLPEQAKVWTELNAIGGCNQNISGDPSGSGATINGTDPTKVNTWFDSNTVAVGMHVDPKDGKLDCNDENGWITSLLNDANVQPGYYSQFYKSTDGTAKGIQDALTKGLFGLAGKPGTIPDQLKYYILMQAFVSSSQSSSCAAAPEPSTPDAKAKYQNGPIAIWVANGGQVSSQPYMYNNQSDTTTVGAGVRSGGTTYSCGALASVLNSSPEGLNMASAFASNDTTDNPASASGTGIADSTPGCDFNGDPFTWFVCPVIDSMEKMIQKVDNFLTESMTFNTKNFFEDTPGYRTAWNSFRLLGTGLLIVAGLIMLASQALGLEIFDAYTIKKVLPRLLIAIIGMSLSWPLLRYAIDLFNILGVDIRNLIYSPFSSTAAGGNLSAGAMAVISGAVIYQFMALGPLGILSFLATAALAVLVGFIIIIARYLALMVIIIFAPIAIAAYVLPNTQKLWNIWKDNFLGLLLVYPIISAFIAIGRVFSAVSLSGQAPAFGGTTIMQIIGLISYFLPYFLLPIAFRMASGVIGTIAGFVNDSHKGAFDKLKGFRKGQYESHGAVRMHRAKGRVLQGRYKAYRSLGDYSSKADASKVGKFFARRAQGALGGWNIESQISAHNAETAKQRQADTNTGPDNLWRAYTANKEIADQMEKEALAMAPGAARNQALAHVQAHYVKTDDHGNRVYRTAGGAWAQEADVLASERAFGKNNHAAFQQGLEYEMGKANTLEEQNHLLMSYNDARKRFNMNEHEANETWKGAGFAKQNENMQWKHYGWKDDGSGNLVAKMNGRGLYEQFDYKTGSWEQMKQHPDTWVTMQQEMLNAAAVVQDGSASEEAIANARYVLEAAGRLDEELSSSSVSGTPISAGGTSGDASTGAPGGYVSGRQIGAGAPPMTMRAMQAFHESAKLIPREYQYEHPQYGNPAPLANPERDLSDRRNSGRSS